MAVLARVGWVLRRPWLEFRVRRRLGGRMEFSCCFSGDSVSSPEMGQLVIFDQRAVDAGDDDPVSQQFYAHKACFAAAFTPEHRMFIWELEEDDPSSDE
jgi:hypothetical protein